MRLISSNILLLESCTCNTAATKNENGGCQKRYRMYDGLLSCVVNQPSVCTDLVNSTTNSENQLSAEACLDTNRGNIILQSLEQIHLSGKSLINFLWRRHRIIYLI